MTRAQIRQLVLLGGLGTTLGGVLYLQRDTAAIPAGATPAPAQGASAAAPLGALAVADIRLEALGASRGDEPASDRNPFRFRARPAPSAGGPAGGRAGRGAAAPPPPPTPPVRAEPQGPPPPPPITLRFIGIVDPANSDARAAVFSDMRGNVFNGREGDVIEGRYRVLRVGADAAELAYIDGRGRQTIRLSGQ